MVDTKWELKSGGGMINKREFPYVTHFWDKSKDKTGFYVGLTADIGMDSKEIGLMTSALARYFEKYDTSNMAVGFEKKYQSYNQKAKSFRELLKLITGDYSSPWYSDSVWFIFDLGGAEIFVEPEADGTEVGIFFSGNEAQEAYDNFLGWISTDFRSVL